MQDKNIALLIDADNASLNYIEDVLLVLGEFGTINIRRAYGNWQKQGLHKWDEVTGRHSIVPVQQFDIVKGKSATDMRMVIDAMDLLYRGHVDGFGIMSSDSDFLPLAQRIRENGLPVFGFGEAAKAPSTFQNSCTRFFDVAAFGKEAAGSNASEKTTEPAAPAAGDLVELLGGALKASARDDEGFASLAEVGSRLSAVSSFSARNYGYKSLSELVRARSEFQTKTDAGKSLRIKRVR